MSNQQLPSRPWLRFGSITRPAVPSTLTAVPASPPPAAPAPAPVPSPPSLTTPLLRPSLPLPTSVRQVAAESSPPLPPLGRSPSMAAMATWAQQPKEPTPLPHAISPSPAPVLGIPSKRSPPAATTGSLVPSSAIKKQADPTEALPAYVKPLNETVPSASVSPPTLLPSQIKVPEKDVPPSEAERKNKLLQKIRTVPEQKPGNVGVIRPPGAQKTGSAAAVEKGTIDGDADMVKKLETRNKGVEVIVMAGENRGATMEPTGRVMNHQEKIGNGFSNRDEGIHGTKNRGHKGNAAATTFPRLAVCVNSNVQGVNNVILYNSYCKHGDPGVHMALPRKPDDGGFLGITDHKP